LHKPVTIVGVSPIHITRGIDMIVVAFVKELKLFSKEMKTLPIRILQFFKDGKYI
jgi:hypothetical protein